VQDGGSRARERAGGRGAGGGGNDRGGVEHASMVAEGRIESRG
jgi:hypothetical protein